MSSARVTPMTASQPPSQVKRPSSTTGLLLADKEFHMMTFEELRRRFDLDMTTGLSSEQAVRLLKKHGKNQLRISYTRLVRVIVGDLFDYLSIMLWLSAVLSLISYKPLGYPPLTSNLITALVLFASLLAKAFLAAYQSFNSIRSLRGFHNDKDLGVHVLRNSSCRLVPVSELVLGDVVYLMPNQRVPAALRLIETRGLVLDKSALTGETDYVEASAMKCSPESRVLCFEANNMALPNCVVVHGEGMGVVVALSTHAEFGIGLTDSSLDDLKPHRYAANRGVIHELGRFVLVILIICLAGAIIYLIAFFAYIQPTYWPPPLIVVSDVIKILVSGVPFGVPVAIAFALFLVSRELKKRSILVKDVFAIDSLSSVDVIITDKTGTLTRNELKVCNVLQATKEVDPELCYYDPVRKLIIYYVEKESLFFKTQLFKKRLFIWV